MTGPTAPGAQGGRPAAGRLPRTCCGPASARWTSRPLEVPYLSYYPARPFQGVHDRLYARALAVEGRRATPASSWPSTPRSQPGVLGQGEDYIATVRAEVERTGIPRRTSCWPPATPTPHPRARTSPIWRRSSPAPAPGWRCWRGRSRRPWPRPGPGAPGGAGTTGLCPGVAWNRRILTRDGRLVRLAARPPDDQVLKEPATTASRCSSSRTPLPFLAIQGTGGGLDGLHLPPHHRPGAAPRLGRLPGSGLRHRGAGAGGRGCLFLQGACGMWALCGRRPASGTCPSTGGPWEARPCAASPCWRPRHPPCLLFPGYRQRGGGGPPPALPDTRRAGDPRRHCSTRSGTPRTTRAGKRSPPTGGWQSPCAWPAWGRGRCAWRCRRCAWERP